MMELAVAENIVLETLRLAASQDAGVLKPAEEKLKEWEVVPGFYSILLNIISNHSIDVTVRWLAVLFFKNGVERYWRKNSPNAISEAEKVTLRLQLMDSFHEPVNQIATQLAVLISKAARWDCPREWPELIPNLLVLVQAEDLLVQHRGLLTLHHVIKALASKRLPGDRRLFQELTANLYPFAINLWNSYYDLFFRQMEMSDPQCQGTLEKTLLSLRILRKLTVHGFKAPHESQDVVLFVTAVLDRAKTMLHCRKSMEGKSEPLTEGCGKVAIHLTKVLLGLLEHQPFSYVPFIPTTLQTAVTLVVSPEHGPFLFERFIVQCLNLVKGILCCAEFKMTKGDLANSNPASAEAHRVKHQFFTPEVLTVLCTKIVTHFFLLTRDDLEMWDANPEEFASEDIGESWKYSLRPCTESLFLALFHEFRATLCPVLLDLIKHNHLIVSPDNMDAILQKDAVYNAVGLAAFDLYDEVDFDQWFCNTLTLELKVKESNYRVIRRRVAWLIGRWTAVKLSPDLRPTLYEALISLLQGGEDMAVRLTAAVALKHTVDDFEFNSEQFLEFLEPVFNMLFSLLKEAKECDIKMQVLYVLSFIVERMGVSIKPHSSALIGYLPLLWEESANHNMLRCAIVSTLVQFVRALVSDNLTSFLYPVIELCCDVQQDAYVYLLEDGLELWFAVLENSTQLTPNLLQLFTIMPPVLEFTAEYLKCCCSIIQAYVLLSPQEFLSMYGESLVTVFSYLLSDMNKEGVFVIMETVTMATRACPALAIPQATPLVNFALMRAYNADDLPMLMTAMLGLLARVILHSPDSFYQLLDVAAKAKNETAEGFTGQVVSVWLNTMRVVSNKEDKKLLALALCSLLTFRPLQKVLLTNLSAVMRNMVETLYDVADMDSNDSYDSNPPQSQVDTVMAQYHEDCDADTQAETDHEVRRRHLVKVDPVYNVVLHGYLQAQLNLLRDQLGQATFETLVRNMDPAVTEQTATFINL